MSNAAAPATEGPDRTGGPLHVAIIMDGNGRWAAARGLPRAEGHRRGVEALRRVVRAAHELGVLYLTIFSFSSENWSRPATEIGDLFGLLRRFIRNDLASLHRDGVRVRVIGEREGLEGDICVLLNEAEELTKANTKLNLVVAFNYGSRQEIANAARRLAREVAEGKRDPASIDADAIGQYLDAPDIPDPDLIIRTSGEQRLSNFLMWQAAYSELVFVPIHWPDFDKAALEGASAALAVWPRKPDRDRGRCRAGGCCRAGFAQSPDARHRRGCTGSCRNCDRICRRMVVDDSCHACRDRSLHRMADDRRRGARGARGRVRSDCTCDRRLLFRARMDRWSAPCVGARFGRRRVALARPARLDGGRILLCRRGAGCIGAGAPRP